MNFWWFDPELNGGVAKREFATLEQVFSLSGERITAVAHRVVHGGLHYFAPVRVTQNVIDDLRRYIPLAPLHQPFPLKAMSLLLEQFPQLPQVACFDTAFHRSAETIEQMFALPWPAWLIWVMVAVNCPPEGPVSVPMLTVGAVAS